MAKSKTTSKARSLSLTKFLFTTLLVAILAIAAYFILQNKNSSENQLATDPVLKLTDWNTYTNTKYGFTLNYPETGKLVFVNPDGSVAATQTEAEIVPKPLTRDGAYTDTPLEAADSVVFDIDTPMNDPHVFYFDVFNEWAEDGPITQKQLEEIFALKVGEELSKETTSQIHKSDDSAGKYKRIPDIQINDLSYFAIENPHGYWGINRMLFLKKDGKIFMTDSSYNSDETLQDFERFYKSLKFDN